MTARGDLYPPYACPKCGDPWGLHGAKARYVSGWGSADPTIVRALTPNAARERDLEHLEWECKTCGYVVATTTADKRPWAPQQEPEAPPPPDLTPWT